MAQPVTEQEALNDSIIFGQGFLARFLLAAPENLIGSRKIDVNLILERRKSGSYKRTEMQPFWNRCEEVLATKVFVNDLNENEPPALKLDALPLAVISNNHNHCKHLI